MQIETPQFTTYLQSAQSLIESDPKFYSKAEQKGVLSFAKYLDSGRDLNNDLKILGLMQSRKFDGEVIQAFIDAVGIDRAKEIAAPVYARHKRIKG